MSDQNRYPRRDRRDEEDEGFIDRVKDWFGLRSESERRDRYYPDRFGRDRPRYEQTGSRRYNQDRVRVYDTRDRNQGYSDYGRGYGSDRPRSGYRYDFDRNLGRDYDRETRYSQDPYNRDWEYGLGEDYRDEYNRNYGYGRGYRSSPGYSRSSSQDYRRDFEREQDYASNRDYDRYDDRNTGRDRGWSYDEDYGDRYNNRQGNRFSNRRDYGRGSSEWDRPYPTAGMRSDYSGYGYRENDAEDMWDDETSMYEDYVGYDSEGAFYQDLDNPYTSDWWEVWMVPGQYTGMGPQNYNRSDEQILEEVCERLTRHGRIDASDIDVKVENGDVTLSGSVPSRDMKRMAEDAADSISGVNDVRNEIKVTQRERPIRSQGRYPGRERGANRDQVGADFYGWSESGMPASENRMQTSENEGDTSEQNWVADQSGSEGERARLELRPGMEVIDQSGKVIGTVKEIRASDFLVDRELARDVFVPFDVIQSVGKQVMVNVAKDDVDNQGWQNP
jgi:hypothetical protein